MTGLRVLLGRVWATLAGRRDDRVREEIDTHLALLADEHRRRGLSDAEARAAARRDFGGVEPVRLEWIRQRRLPSLDAFAQDVRFAARRLMTDRWSTAAAIGILALGVGSTVVMADMLDRLLLRPPDHVADPDRVRRVYTHIEGGRPHALVTFYASVEHLRQGLSADISHIAAVMREEIGYGRGPEASRFRAVTHSSCYFDVLGLRPHRGRLPGCGRARQPDTVVISHAVWQQHFGGRDDVLGRVMRLGTRTYTIVAVTPPAFTGVDAEPADLWLPLESRADEGRFQTDWRVGNNYAMLQVLVRLRPGMDVRAAEERATTVLNTGPSLGWADGKTRTSYVRLGELAPARQPGGTTDVHVSLATAAVSAFVLLIACGNVGNLLFVRGLRRGRELAVKTALGATRGRLFRELIVEACLLAVLASAAALAFVHWGGAGVRALLLPEGSLAGAGLDLRLLLLTAAVCAAATLALGLLPALRLVARASLAPARSIARERSSLLLDSYVALQVALSVPLLAGAALFGLSLWQARQVDFGMTTSRVAVVSTDMHQVSEPERNHQVHRDMQARLAELPQVERMAAVAVTPLRGGVAQIFDIPGVDVMGAGYIPSFINAVDVSYFTVMGIPIVSGRAFTDEENRANGPPAAIVGESMARTYWPNQSPLGQCIRVGSEQQPCAQIVGVARDTIMWGQLAEVRGETRLYYVPLERYADRFDSRALLLRTTTSPSGLVDLLRRQAATAAPDLPHIQVSAFDDVFLPALRPLRLGATVFAVFALMALVIASAGLAAVTASGVARRTRELGIRLALGADPARLVRMVLLRSLAAALVGLAAGAALSVAGERSLRSVLFGVGEGDYRVVALALAILALVTAVAAWLPARRAGQVDPVIALRTD